MNHQADVVVVGSGIAGSLVAYRLARKGLKVIILEAGPRIDRSKALETFFNAPVKHHQSPYPAQDHALHPGLDPDSKPYIIEKGPHKYDTLYVRGVGGTTWHWAGETWRYLPSDLKLRSTYGIGRDWPLRYEDIEPYYCEAEAEIGVSGSGDLGSPRSKPYPMQALAETYMDSTFKRLLQPLGYDVIVQPAARNTRPYDDRPACCGNHNCMPLCPIGAQYSGDVHATKAEKAGAQLIENAVAYKVEVGVDRQVKAIHYKDPSGQSHVVTAKTFVIAAHGIETPKLLLISQSEQTPNGVANSSDQVGRNLMDHPGFNVEFTMPEPVYPGRGPQEVCGIVTLRDGDFRKDYGSIKIGLWNSNSLPDITRAQIERGYVGRELDRRIRDVSSRRCVLTSFHEQLPNPANRVTASALKDPIGIPRPEITYSIDAYTLRSVSRIREVFGEMMTAFKATDVRYADSLQPNNHIMGTTIMGDDPHSSVVDKHCRTHDHKNLFIASSSVFASSAAVNSTLTIAALSLQIADQIGREFNRA
jgi:choline dehydrogenase-like flavoprotein